MKNETSKILLKSINRLDRVLKAKNAENNTQRTNILLKLEASRHFMANPENKHLVPNWKITPELQRLREKVFPKDDPSAQYYLNNDDNFRQTIASRLVSNDTHILDYKIPVTPEMQEHVNRLDAFMEERRDAPYVPSDNLISPNKKGTTPVGVAYGFPIVNSEDHVRELDDYLKDNPHVAAMATGGHGDGELGETPALVVNKYSPFFKGEESDTQQTENNTEKELKSIIKSIVHNIMLKYT